MLADILNLRASGYLIARIESDRKVVISFLATWLVPKIQSDSCHKNKVIRLSSLRSCSLNPREQDSVPLGYTCVFMNHD